MKGRNVRLFVITIIFTGMFAGGATLATAQDNTPAADAAITVYEMTTGATAEIFASAASVRAADQTVYLARFVFQPGSGIFPHSHPGTTLLGIESGTFGWTLVEGTAHVVRGAGTGTTEPVEDITEPGREVILNPGDAIFYEDDVIHTARGAGVDPTVVMARLVLTSAQPLLMTPEQMAEMVLAGTPAA